MNLNKFIKIKNFKKIIFTPGPGPLLKENLLGLEPCFGRDDKDYEIIEDYVLSKIKKIAGQENIVRLQGSASLALEIGVLNFLYGKILIINSGVYSKRILKMIVNAKKTFKYIKEIKSVDWKNIDLINSKYDWVVSCYTETSLGLKISIQSLKNLKKRTKSKLFLDATASIGLEKNHEISDICVFSSCKGLFGLTGASFITYNIHPRNKVKSFYLSINSHINKMMTGPYHSILSLYYVLKKYKKFRLSVIENKKKFMKKYGNLSPYKSENQPLLCTYINKKVLKKKNKVILYKPRNNIDGSIICHLGEAHLKEKATGKIIDNLKIL